MPCTSTNITVSCRIIIGWTLSTISPANSSSHSWAKASCYQENSHWSASDRWVNSLEQFNFVFSFVIFLFLSLFFSWRYWLKEIDRKKKSLRFIVCDFYFFLFPPGTMTCLGMWGSLYTINWARWISAVTWVESIHGLDLTGATQTYRDCALDLLVLR